MRSLSDQSNAACILSNLLQPKVNVVVVKDTHYTCTNDERLQEDVFPAYGEQLRSNRVSLQVKCSLNAEVNAIVTGTAGRLAVADIGVKSDVPSGLGLCVGKRHFFLRQLRPYLMILERIPGLIWMWPLIPS